MFLTLLTLLVVQVSCALADFLVRPPLAHVIKTRKVRPAAGSDVARAYSLVSSAQGKTFFDTWNFEEYPNGEPTHGSVTYVNATFAKAKRLVSFNSKYQAIMAVDKTSNLPLNKYRNSVRISSKTPLQQGQLLIMDAAHVPNGCATWPAFWTVGSNWPNQGEIDIYETVNTASQAQMTLHTANGCTVATPMNGTGTVQGSNCYAYANNNAGCGISDSTSTSYGAGLNANGGGVWATLWNAAGINLWFWPRGSIPSDIAAGTPVPFGAAWGKPKASFGNSTCSIKEFFGPQTIVFDTTLCGDWAGSVYPYSGCPGTCAERVQKGSNFKNAYWAINYVKVFA